MRKVSLAEIGGRGAFVADGRYRPPEAMQAAGDPVREAYEHGFAEGQAAAREQLFADQSASNAERKAIELAFARFDEASAALLRERLHATVLAICQDMAGPVALDSHGLAARVDAAAALIRSRHDQRVVRLHPTDLGLVQDRVDPGLTLLADPAIPRGSLRVDGKQGGVEDGAEQWRAALEEALGRCSP